MAILLIWEEIQRMRFSPLREGDTSVALVGLGGICPILSFSPLREGDTSVAWMLSGLPMTRIGVSVPFARGTPPWRANRRVGR